MTQAKPLCCDTDAGRRFAEPALVSDGAAAHDTFWSKVAIADTGDCWPWQRSLRQGYGVYWNGRKNVAAHRFAVEISRGPIPTGMVVDHTCRNRACVNPAHLRIVTVRQNLHENSEAIPHLRSQSETCIHGHPLSGANLGRTTAGHRRCIACNTIRCRERRAARKAAAQ